ncbi:phosphatase PAP2 family protein [Candidatus Peregrinibacteria bacterium]|nr:phosphatase PAP2 family protein [Candidatus Peregrinibacteria bacterium]
MTIEGNPMERLWYALKVLFFYGITALANFSAILLASAVLTVMLWTQHRRTHVLVLWLTLIGSEGMATIGKLLFRRPRPSGLLPAIMENSYSFPSGHATSAVVLFGFLAYLLIREHRSWQIKVSAFLTALLLVFLVDLSRLYLGVHYVSDVLAGNALALTVLLFAIAIGEWLRSSVRETQPSFSWKPIMVALALEGMYVTGFLLFVPLA